MSTPLPQLPPVEPPSLAQRHYERARSAFVDPFRGTVWENAARFRLVGKAYKLPPEQDGRFDITTCRHLAGPLRAWQHHAIRKILVRKAVQTQGSVLLILILCYIIEHDPGSTLILLESDEKAATFANERFVDTLRAHPVIGPMIVSVESHDRFNSTTTYVKFPHMTVFIGGLNDKNVSSLAWQYVLISEAWFHKDDGLLFKAFGRTTQYEQECKILVESQAGMEGEDFARECELALRIPLTWVCPCCGGRQEWEFSNKRPEDFKARLPRERVRAILKKHGCEEQLEEVMQWQETN